MRKKFKIPSGICAFLCVFSVLFVFASCGRAGDVPPAPDTPHLTEAQSAQEIRETAAAGTETSVEETALPSETAPAETASVPPAAQPEEETSETAVSLDKDGSYTSPEDVAEYIHTFGTLPSNFITKKDAKALGWSGGDLWKFADGMSIGGDFFGNYEGLLPEKKGRKYTECDVNYNGGSRGAERIIFSNDGLIFYTGDHYSSFTQLY